LNEPFKSNSKRVRREIQRGGNRDEVRARKRRKTSHSKREIKETREQVEMTRRNRSLDFMGRVEMGWV